MLRSSPVRPLFLVFRLGLGLLVGSAAARAAPIDDAREQLRHGDYEGAITLARAVKTEAPAEAEAWLEIEARALLELGRYAEADQRLSESVTIVLFSLPLRLLQREASLHAGKAEGANLTVREVVRAMNFAAATRGADYIRSADFQAVAGEASLLAGLEPRLALENFLKPAQRARPPSRRAFLVAGQLALDKRDFALASRTFQEGLAAFPDDPDLLCGLAAAFQSGDRKLLLANAERALAVNPRHVASHLLLAEHFIDAERRDTAAMHLDLALAVNPHSPDAHALRAVLAFLDRDPLAAERHRAEALATWKNNPRVDYLIGRKLADQYQFADAAAAQRRALELDPDFTPAKVQLAQDLLRLAREDEGWALAEQAHRADAYNVEAFNLTTLHDQLAHFTTVENPHFRVRMAADEAPIYGDRALALLERARTHLTARYGIALDQPTTVEIYPDPKDFAVRTFGLPDIGGFLGVCFGPVFTINSPASAQANWEAVLWHEFTHVITLTLTRNRMPRWLSEGISVYEERQANRAWSQLMSLDYRDRILDGKLQPISRMSSAFLEAQDGRDTQFAYFQSALVVEFLVERYGFDQLRALLQSLADGREINAALAQHFAPLAPLDAAFADYARDTALALGPGLDFRRRGEGLSQLIAEHLPHLATLPNVHAALTAAREAAERHDWPAVREKLAPLAAAELYLPGADNFHVLLARAAAELGDTAAERAALTTIAGHEGDALNSVTRLLALAESARDWPAVARWADQFIAINPLAPTPWRALLTAHEQQTAPATANAGAWHGDPARAAHAGEVLLRLDPPDFASIHYRVAKQLLALDPVAARRHTLQALEEAPRFRAAYDLLASLPPAAAPAP
jgi:tetratricopeptide (TPR) repeat protein